MLDRIKGVSKVQMVSYLLFAFSAFMLFVSAYTTFNNMDVITKWDLKLPEQPIHAGDRIIIQSIYTKVRDADGESIRYIDCKNKNGVFLRYELNRRQANRKAKSGGTGIDVVVKSDIPDVPATCKFAVSICYNTFIPWYCHPESNETKEFTLYPKPVASVTSEPSEQPGTNQTPAPASRRQVSSSSVSSSQSTPKQQTQQSNTSQQNDNTPPPPTPSQPNLIERILNSVLNGN